MGLMEKKMETTILCRDYTGVLYGLVEKKMETTIMGLYRDYGVYFGVVLGYWKRKWKLQEL